MKNVLKLLASISVCELIGIAATPFTISAISTWYRYLNKPFFSPPNWIFGPVWTTLYFLMGIALYLIWQKGINKKKNRVAIYFFSIQLFLNFTWSLLFFGLHSPILGFINIVLLWIFIFMTILKFKKISPLAARLMYPYLAWVSFASLLNLFIIILN